MLEYRKKKLYFQIQTSYVTLTTRKKLLISGWEFSTD